MEPSLWSTSMWWATQAQRDPRADSAHSLHRAVDLVAVVLDQCSKQLPVDLAVVEQPVVQDRVLQPEQIQTIQASTILPTRVRARVVAPVHRLPVVVVVPEVQRQMPTVAHR